jgi:hypothetical protein
VTVEEVEAVRHAEQTDVAWQGGGDLRQDQVGERIAGGPRQIEVGELSWAAAGEVEGEEGSEALVNEARIDAR